MREIKKLTSIFLSALLAFSMTAVSFGSVSAVVDENGCYAPGDNVDATHRYYFAMPDEWYNEYTDTAGVYWWSGTDACGSIDGTGGSVTWPGYKAQKSDVKNVYYIDCPTNVPTIVWNNYIDGGMDKDAPVYSKAKQAKDTNVEFCSDGDSDIYDSGWFSEMENSYNGDKALLGDYVENFFYDENYGFSFLYDNMIYVIDPTKTSVNFEGKKIYIADWYFYYGNGEYGTYPTKKQAKKHNTLNNINGQGKIYFDAKKSGWNLDFNIKYFCHIWRADSSDYFPVFQSESELCTFDKTTGIVTYDLSKNDNKIYPDDGAIYNVVFSSVTGMQTYTAVMSGKCIGDTLYCTGEKIENPEDPEKECNVAVWENNPDCGPEKRITSTGNIVGFALHDGETNEMLLADYLICYYDNPEKTKMTQRLINELNVAPVDVFEEVVNSCNNQDATQTIANILIECSNPKEEVIGDVDGNGEISVSDATLIQKYLADLTEFTAEQIKIADVNGDGVVNVHDATAIQLLLVS